MIVMSELLKGKKLSDISDDIKQNLLELLDRINIVREKWDKPMVVTSGLRSLEDHLRIYREKGITDKAKIPMQSRHLSGRAVDIADSGLAFTKWLKENPSVLENAQLWCEEGNSSWVHFQSVPPKSGKRWFLP